MLSVNEAIQSWMLNYCAFQLHANSQNSKLNRQMHFSLPGVNQVSGGSCREHGNHAYRSEHSSDNETVLGSSCKLGGAAEHLIEGSKNAFFLSKFES